ncbi:MAG TPA: LysM peptidoglycan-binding domain-containing protein [Gemmatimonadaceae bacterium]|nr:LysM peptidoglycan-binding domain-containing protein [Gemmatimonadaceae bacterium]
MPRIESRFLPVTLVLALACHSPRPATAPVPVSTPGASPDTATLAARGADTAAAADTSDAPKRDVTGEAVKIFGDSVGASSADSAAEAAEPEAPTWDIDVRSYETQSRVAFFIDRYQHAAHDRFASWLERGGRYEPMIRAKLHAAGLPEDLTYLALIESGYDPHAYSSAAAVGIWQLMTSTARDVGLRVDWWVDERRDPVRSTEGAIKFLGYLEDQFGSLFLAAAAYNGGPGRISRGLTRYADDLEGQTGDQAFFALAEKDYLRAETKDYVPRLIAAALVAKDPKRYGFDITPDSALVYDTVRVGPATPLAAVAAAAHVEVSRIMTLNPGILRGVTPPHGSYTVHVPSGAAEGFDSAFAALPKDVRTAYTLAKTRKGETLMSLARRAGISVKELRWYNPELHPNRRGRLPAGEAVRFPSHAVVAAALDVPDPSIERYGSSGSRVASHVVKRGESLGLIAERYHTTVASLKRLNGLKKTVIYPGQVIIVRGSRARASASRSSHRSTASRGRATGGKIHVVKRGESLTSIARKYDTTVKALKKLNDLDGDMVRAGQKLVVRG